MSEVIIYKAKNGRIELNVSLAVAARFYNWAWIKKGGSYDRADLRVNISSPIARFVIDL